MLDIILEVFESDWENGAYISLIQHFNRQAIPQILGFKMQMEKEPSSRSETPKSLFRVAAQLMKANCLGLADLWPYLLPEDKDMQASFNNKLEIAKSIANRANTIKLAGTSQAHQEDKEKEKKEFLEMKKQQPDNQKLWLLEALIRENAWAKAEEVYYFMKDYYDPTFYQPLLQALFDILHWAIEPIYRKVSYTKFFPSFVAKTPFFPEEENGVSRADDFVSFYNSVGKILKLLGIHISQDTLLYIKICRIIKASLKSEREKPAGENIVKAFAESLCAKVLLPALSLIKCNPGVCTELWEVLREFEYSERYIMYQEWLSTAYFSQSHLIVQYALTTKDTRKWLKRLAKVNIRQTGKLLAKISHNNPCLVFDIILTQTRSYENQIQSIVSALNNCSQLTLDSIAYDLLRHISDCKDKLELDGNISPWLNNLSTFCGHFFRKHYWVDVIGILHYICGKLKTSHTCETVVLAEIMSKMTGYSNLDIDKMTEKQFEAMAGGKTLQIEALNFSDGVRRAKTSSHQLAQFLWKKTNKENIAYKAEIQKNPISKENSENRIEIAQKAPLSLAMTINVLLAQNIQSLLFRKEAIQLKQESSVYDRLQSLFHQFNLFISDEAETPEQYEALLPVEPITKFVAQYKLPPEVVFQIYTPCLKPLYEYSEEDYTKIIASCKEVLDRHLANLISEKNEEESEYFTESKYMHDKVENLWEAISPELYTIFWVLKLSDIVVPKERYEDEITRLTNDNTTLQSEGRSADSAQTMKKTERNKQTIQNLKTELQKQTESHKKYLKFLESRKDLMISKVTKKSDLSVTLVQYCIFPRLMFSPSDAIYAIKMIIYLYKLKVKMINILDIVGVLLKRMLPAIQCCTEKEAYNFGIFFLEVFRLIQYWQSETVWKAECFKTPGFAMYVGSGDSIDYSEFKDATNVIYKKFAVILQKCIGSQEYMQGRNALIVLKRLTPYFPRNKSTAEALDKELAKLINETTKDDLNLMAGRYKDILSKKMTDLPDDPVRNYL